MVDLILIASHLGLLYCGFKLGNKFKTVKDAVQAGIDSLSK